MLATGLAAVLAVSFSIATFIYFQNQSNQQAGTYTIVGTLRYAPGHAVWRGISVTSITPGVSPEPSNVTFTEANGVNYTVASFVYLNFSNKFTFPQNGSGIDYPVGFGEGEAVKVSGQMGYSTVREWYTMNVTSITHYSS